MKQPEIRIKDAWLLRQNASVYLHELWAGKDDVLADDDWMESRVEQYQKAWRPFEKKILEGMTEIMEMGFRKNIIDVYIAPWFGAFSDPLVIGVMDEPDRFVDSLTHELIHCLLVDNTITNEGEGVGDQVEKLYGKDGYSFEAQIHIMVHAIHKAIYLDVLKDPSRLERDKAWVGKDETAKDYEFAWEYVDEHGYKEIIDQIKAIYKKLAKEQASTAKRGERS